MAFMWSSTRASLTFCCVPCRRVSKAEIWRKNTGMSSITCSRCQLPMQNMGSRWCPPKKNNHKAWRAIANGDILWDSSRIAKKDLRGLLYRAKSGKY